MSVVRINGCPYQGVFFFKEMYELLVGECQTVRINRVSVERGSTVAIT